MSGFLSAMSTVGRSTFQLAMELSPILLTNGIAQQITGGALPIVVFTEAANFTLGLLSGFQHYDLDDFFAHFQPLPGSTLLDLQIGQYPFANQAVAANATISQPLQLSYLMRCPARNAAGYASKLATMIALQQVLTQHAALGGTYVCITPAAILSNGILTNMRDVSDTQSKQVQNAYQLDFTFPLLTLEQAQASQTGLMKKLTAQTQISGTPSFTGPGATLGDPSSLGGIGTVPVSNGITASTIAPNAAPSLSGI